MISIKQLLSVGFYGNYNVSDIIEVVYMEYPLF